MSIRKIAIVSVGAICAVVGAVAIAVAAIPGSLCACLGGMNESPFDVEALEE